MVLQGVPPSGCGYSLLEFLRDNRPGCELRQVSVLSSSSVLGAVVCTALQSSPGLRCWELGSL